MDLKEQEALGDAVKTHWYYRAKSAAMLSMLGDTPIDDVLDVGAGSGFFARFLLANTPCRTATCVDPNYARDWSETEAGKPVRYVRHVSTFDGHLALMMDVIEHVPDDVGLLRDYAQKMPPGSRILITVPAMPWMWSGHDVFLEHYRRYTLQSLEQAIAKAGLKRVSSCYYFGLTLPLAAGLRFGRKLVLRTNDVPVSDMRPQGKLTNAMLLAICRLELGIFRANRLAGLSAFALAEV